MPDSQISVFFVQLFDKFLKTLVKRLLITQKQGVRLGTQLSGSACLPAQPRFNARNHGN